MPSTRRCWSRFWRSSSDVRSEITYREPRLRVVSNVTGRVAAAGEMSHAGYWRRHMRSTVLFHAGLQAALATGCSTLLEIGPQPHLSTLGKLAEPRPDLLWLPSLRKGRNAWLDLLSTARALYEDGFDIQWAAVHGRAGSQDRASYIPVRAPSVSDTEENRSASCFAGFRNLIGTSSVGRPTAFAPGRDSVSVAHRSGSPCISGAPRRAGQTSCSRRRLSGNRAECCQGHRYG